MIEIREVLGWFYEKELSQIPADLRCEIDEIPGLPPDVRQVRTGRLINTANHMNTGPLKAELLVNCFVLRYEEGMAIPNCFDEANALITEANDHYCRIQADQRLAATNFMRSMVLTPLRKYWDSAMYAKNALAYFIQEMDYRRSENHQKKKRANKIAVDLLTSPTDTYDFLFRFSPSRLCVSARRIQKNLRDTIEKSDFDLANDIDQIKREMNCLYEIMDHSRIDKNDKGEALSYCGIVRWVIREKTDAAETFKRALDNFNPRDPEYPLISWMSGTIKANICLNDPVQNTRGYRICHVMNGLEKSVCEIEDLQQRSNRANQPDRANWYACLKDSMEIYLNGIAGQACGAPAMGFAWDI